MEPTGTRGGGKKLDWNEEESRIQEEETRVLSSKKVQEDGGTCLLLCSSHLENSMKVHITNIYMKNLTVVQEALGHRGES